MIPKLWTPDEDCNLSPGGIALCAGNVKARILDRPKPGELYGEPLTDWFGYDNNLKTVLLNYLWETGVRSGVAITAWYMGLIDDAGFSSSENAADTMASHASWAELTTYTAATRIAWAPGAAASGTITIALAITFTTNADSNIRGIFITSNATKSSATGTLFSAASKASASTILSGQQYQAIYSATLTPG